jgi:UDPglucose 6-dehydrogenase
MNEMARLCEKIGADVELVRQGMTLDPRIGKPFMYPGIGYGGSCFPKDTRALVSSARAHAVDATIVAAAEEVNRSQKTILMPKIKAHFNGNLKGKTFALWGLAFKPRTDDIREAPALAMIEALRAEGAAIRAFDPEAAGNVRALLGEAVYFARDPYDALIGAEALLLITEWNEFRTPDWPRIKQLLKSPVVFDGRNIYNPKRLRTHGFTYFGVGRS